MSAYLDRPRAKAPTPLTVGLRFKRDQAPRLRAIADRIRTGDTQGDTSLDVSTFEQAAIAAEQGTPMHLHCKDKDEIDLITAGYVLWGIKEPAVEDLPATERNHG